MDRRKLIGHLENRGSEFVREGGNHTVPRRREVKDTTAREICKDLGIPNP